VVVVEAEDGAVTEEGAPSFLEAIVEAIVVVVELLLEQGLLRTSLTTGPRRWA
jgi:hypothetical protein